MPSLGCREAGAITGVQQVLGASEMLMSTGCSSTYTAAFMMVFSLCAHSLLQLLCHQKPAVPLSHLSIIWQLKQAFWQAVAVLWCLAAQYLCSWLTLI